MKLRLLVLSLLLASVASGRASDTPAPATSPPDKSGFNLFHPTPDNLLRGFSADRPSQSTGPYTVDAGHFYFETSAVSYLFDRAAGTEVRQWNVFPINFRIGVTNNIEFDLAYQDYIHLRVRDGQGGGTETRSGFGDLTLQSKINLFGNDGGKIAFGLIPFLKIPTNTHGLGNDSAEGGLSIPFQAALPGGFGLGLQSGASFVRNGNDTGYDASFFNAILLSHTLFTDRLSAYGEFYDVVTTGAGDTHAAFIDFGLVYQVAPNAEVDVGCNFGVSEAAPDYQPFVGFGFRF